LKTNTLDPGKGFRKQQYDGNLGYHIYLSQLSISLPYPNFYCRTLLTNKFHIYNIFCLGTTLIQSFVEGT